ncbi:MAG: HAMP domain-containing sensor histidine kinase, partial [bacterium]
MKIRNNLRLRFVLTFALFTLLMSASFGVVVFLTQRKQAKVFFRNRIVSELDYFAAHYQQNPQTPLPRAEDIRAYLGTGEMTPFIRKAVEGFSDGIHTMDLDRVAFFKRTDDSYNLPRGIQDHHDVFFGVKTLADGRKVYIFIDFIYWHQMEHEIQAHAFWTFVVISLVAVVLGLITGNYVIQPLNRLVDVVSKSDPENMPTGFSRLFKDDEIGALAKALDASLNRVKQFIRREHQFTRDASHELRTPVTVIKGAVELLNMAPACEDNMVDKLVKRIERSTRDMETTIESMLWLARESNSGEPGIPADLLPLVENAMAQNRHLLAGKPVEMTLQVNATPVILAPAGVLTIALSNLIRNACQFTSQGRITVTLEQDRVEVVDTGVGIEATDLAEVTKPDVSSPASAGFGFGLDIVTRLCTRFGWKLQIES